MNVDLMRPYSFDEVKHTVFSMKAGKSPGMDGFNPRFYQAYWDLVGDSISYACTDMLLYGMFAASLNDIALVLIPIKSEPESISDLHPITLYNVVFKIVTKMIANRLRILLPSIVTEHRSAFVLGRHI